MQKRQTTNSYGYNNTAPIYNPARQLSDSGRLRYVLFILAHIPLAIAVRNSPPFATGFVILVTVVALTRILRSDNPKDAAIIIAYIIASEVLWRSRTYLFFEYVKYASVALLAVSIIHYRLLPTINRRPIIYFALLLPSILVLPYFDRQAISFNLSGPLIIAVALAFFSQVSLEKEDLLTMLRIMLGPLIGVVFLATLSTVTAQNIDFIQASNRITAGASGPNQISAVMSFGAFMTFIIIMIGRPNGAGTLGYALMGSWLIGQAMLTFSRGGVITAAGAIVVASFFLLGDRRSRFILLGSAAVGALLFFLFLLPLLDNFTAGALSTRLQDLDTTSRGLAATVDTQVFLDNPLLGVGPGQSELYHAIAYRLLRSHTEYTRMLAEHGILGVGALIMLATIVLPPLIRKSNPLERAVVWSFIAWMLVTISHVATRISMPALAAGIGISMLSIKSDDIRDSVVDPLQQWRERRLAAREASQDN